MSDIFSAAASLPAIAGTMLPATFGPLIGDAGAPPYALISPTVPFRNIGGIFPDVTTEEIHRDELQITQHPVETGAPVTDHAFMQPWTVEIHCGWSNSSAQSEGYVQTVYDSLQALQQARQPFDVTTGKRQYTSMLVRSLLVRTDETSEFTLMVVALCQQIIITDTNAASPATPNTNGQQQVATAAPGGSVNVQGGATQPPPGAISPDANGGYEVPNGPSSAGTQILQPAPAGAPTLESLSANQGG